MSRVFVLVHGFSLFHSINILIFGIPDGPGIIEECFTESCENLQKDPIFYYRWEDFLKKQYQLRGKTCDKEVKIDFADLFCEEVTHQFLFYVNRSTSVDLLLLPSKTCFNPILKNCCVSTLYLVQPLSRITTAIWMQKVQATVH